MNSPSSTEIYRNSPWYSSVTSERPSTNKLVDKGTDITSPNPRVYLGSKEKTRSFRSRSEIDTPVRRWVLSVLGRVLGDRFMGG